MSIASASIQKFEMVQDGHVEYFINVVYLGKQWSVRKRYSDFAHLDSFIRQQGYKPQVDLPPKRGIFTINRTDMDFLVKRKDQLQSYVNSLFVSPMSPENSLVKEFLEVDEHHLQSDLRDTKRSYAHFKTMNRMRRIIEDTNARIVPIQSIRYDGSRRISASSRNGMVLRTNSYSSSIEDKASPNSSSTLPLSVSPHRRDSNSNSFSGWMRRESKEGKPSLGSLNYDQDTLLSSSPKVSSIFLKSSLMTGLHRSSGLSQDFSQSRDDSTYHLQLLALENLVHNMYTLQTRENSEVQSSTYFFEKDGKSIFDILAEPVKQSALIDTADDIMRRISSKELKNINLCAISPDFIVVNSFKSQPEPVPGIAQVILNTDVNVENVNKDVSRSPRYTPKYGKRANTIDKNNDSGVTNSENDKSIGSMSSKNISHGLNNGSSVQTEGGGVLRRTRSGSMNMVFSPR